MLPSLTRGVPGPKRPLKPSLRCSSSTCFWTFFQSTPNGGFDSMKSKRWPRNWSSLKVLPYLMLSTSCPLMSMSALQIA